MIDIDNRTKEDIIEEIKNKSASYTPEWRFDESNPDIGTAVALVYADMFSKTIKKFNRVPFKNQVAFFNTLDSKLLPAIPAKGYVCFGVGNEEIQGEEVLMGTVVIAESNEPEIGKIEYEVSDDVFVTPSKVECIYQTYDKEDIINQIYEAKGEEQAIYSLFGTDQRNLQNHAFYFCHDNLLNIKKNAWIEIGFTNRGTQISNKLLEKFMNDNNAVFEYYTEDGYVEFPLKQMTEGHILLLKEEKALPFAKLLFEGKESYWIRCRINSIHAFRNFEFEQMQLSTRGIGIEPDSIYGNDIECKKNEYFPFGERISPYNEVYFASDEVLCKKGAEIELAFNLDFVRIPLNYNLENDPIKWQWIMKKDNFKPNYEYDLTIEEVSWEYYNGNGWARLFEDDFGSKLFSIEGGVIGQYQKMQFLCPTDMEPILINSCYSYYIRARIIKINNMYKMNGNYLSPVLENTSFAYSYSENRRRPNMIVTDNHMGKQTYMEKDISFGHKLTPFFCTDQENKTVYLGFKIPPIGAPIKMLWVLKDNIDRAGLNLVWQYYDGRKWKELIVVDETENMAKTGIVSIIGNKDISKKILFGKDLYWIRIVDVEDYFHVENEQRNLPQIMGLYMNATKVVNTDKRMEELFMMEIYQENKKFHLVNSKVFDVELYVNELDNLSKIELDELHKAGKLDNTYDESGVLKEAWVQWTQVEEFIFSNPSDRCYVVEPNEGYLVFGNGSNGKIPAASKVENIKVKYKCGGGEYTNVLENQINLLGRSIGYINQIYNPTILLGGCNRETINEALTRNAAIIRHQNKAVTVRDYEELGLSASRSIKRVKCFTGYDAKGEVSMGAVTLVVLQKKYENGQTQFNAIKKDVWEYMSDKINGNLLALGKFFIVEPEFVKINVLVDVVVRNFNDIFAVKKKVQEKIVQFINPLEGNFNKEGWQIGQIPNSIQLSNAINDINGIVYIRNVYMNTFIRGGSEWKEVELETVKKSKYILPVNGDHDVVIKIG